MLFNKIPTAILLFSILVVSAFPAQSTSISEETQAVYLVAQISVKDHQEYMTRYGKPVTQLLVDAGAEILVASRDGEILEGDWSGNWTVVTKFPSSHAAKRWYNSKEYGLFKKLRVNELITEGNIVLLPGLN